MFAGSCKGNEPRCNCDAGLDQERISDAGFLRHKQHLPVLELRFGDTGSLYDTKRGWHSLGPLICAGDRRFSGFFKRDFDKVVPMISVYMMVYRLVRSARDVPQDGFYNFLRHVLVPQRLGVADVGYQLPVQDDC